MGYIGDKSPFSVENEPQQATDAIDVRSGAMLQSVHSGEPEGTGYQREHSDCDDKPVGFTGDDRTVDGSGAENERKLADLRQHQTGEKGLSPGLAEQMKQTDIKGGFENRDEQPKRHYDADIVP